MKRIYLICGNLATGKTSFANIISKKSGVICLCKDDIKERLCDRIGFSCREENLRLSESTFDVMYYALTKAVSAGCDIMLESNFRQYELDKIEKYAVENNYEIVCAYLKCDLHILHRRFLYRIEHENRHQAHKSQNLDRFEDFEQISIEKSGIKFPGKVIEINAENFDFQQDEQLFKRIFLNV